MSGVGESPNGHARSPAGALAIGLVVVGLVAITYSNTFHNSFHYDDIHTIVDNRHIRDLGNISDFFFSAATFTSISERAMFRPLVSATFALNYQLGRHEVFGYHVVNLSLHIACVLLLFLVATSIGFGHIEAASGALFFGIHPVQSEVVNYISSRSESLAALFVLIALVAYVRWRAAGAVAEVRVRKGWGRVLYPASVAAFACALASKSTALALPVALLLYEGTLARRLGDRWSPRTLIRFHAPFWVLSAAYFWTVRSSAAVALGQPVRSLEEQIFSQLKALVYYVKILLMPVSLNVDHQFSAADMTSATAALAAAVLVSLALALVAVRVRRKGTGVPLLGWSLILLLPASLVPLNVLVNEHRLYLSAAFASMWIVSLVLSTTDRSVDARTGNRSVKLWGVAVTLLVLALLTHERNEVWATENSLWQDAVDKAPGMYRTHMHLGGAMEAAGELEAALAQYRKAAEIDPGVALAHYNLANALIRSGRIDEARDRYEHGLELNPTFLHGLVNLAALEVTDGRLSRADALLAKAQALHPSSAFVHHQLGALYTASGKPAEAEKAYREAIRQDPLMVGSHYNLANLYFDLGELEESARFYESALAIEPSHTGALRNLAIVLATLR